MQNIFLTITAMLVLGSYQLVTAQVQLPQNTSMQQSVRDVQERPQLGIEYSHSAKFKLASRKKLYRVGEMISLDLAMLNTSDKQVFFHKLSGPTVSLKVFDEKGAAMNITPSTIALEGVVPQSYSLLSPGEILVGYIQLLAGCNVEGVAAFDEERRKLDESVRQNQSQYDVAVFDRNLFINWGDACLRIAQPGTYTIVVEATNQHIILSPRQPKVKTAIGTIHSNPLTVTISE